MRQPKKILVAPLNWGLGHATRCIPIIYELQAQGAEVILASDGRALELLRQEFPKLTALSLPGYDIRYHSKNLLLEMFKEAPKLLRAVILENKSIQKMINRHELNGIISDNRLGCFSKKIPCAFVTHQVDMILPSSPLQWLVRQVNYWFISRFSECWVPDVAGHPNLSGKLSHGTPLYSKVKFIGALSRMQHFPAEKKPAHRTGRHDVIAVLSGPEPQRTKLEKKIIEQAKKLPQRFLIVLGKPEESEHFFIGKNIEVKSFLPSKELNQAILASDLFVGRPGYSSVMDLAKLGKPAFFIPTPGQTEQEYLADLFATSSIFHSQKQKDFDLKSGIEIAMQQRSLGGGFFDEKKLKDTVKAFLEQ